MVAKGLVGVAAAGPAGFVAGVGAGLRAEAMGAVIDAAAGDAIGAIVKSGIDRYSPLLMKLDGTLTQEQAALLGILAVSVTLNARELGSMFKAMNGVPASGLAMAGGGGKGAGGGIGGSARLSAANKKQAANAFAKVEETTKHPARTSKALAGEILDPNDWKACTNNAKGGWQHPDWVKNKDGHWHHPYAKDFKGVANRPNVNNPELQEAMLQIFRPEDTLPGGTAGMLRLEVQRGLTTSHAEKAIIRILNLDHIRTSQTLSRLDGISLGKVRRDLIDALKIAGVDTSNLNQALKNIKT